MKRETMARVAEATVIVSPGDGGWGSGVFLNLDQKHKHGLVLTCAHVLAKTSPAILVGKKRIKAHVIAKQTSVDLALLGCSLPDSCALSLAKAGPYPQEELCAAGLFWVHKKVVCVEARYQGDIASTKRGRSYLLTAPSTLVRGTSGGPVADFFGDLVGVIAGAPAEQEDSDCYSGFNHVIPLETIKAFLKKIR